MFCLYHLFQNFQEECEAKLKILEEAAASAQKMTTHADSDEKVVLHKFPLIYHTF